MYQHERYWWQPKERQEITESPKYTLGDYDRWYEKCKHCGYDPGRSNNDRCWKCGRRVSRDYSTRALKPSRKTEPEMVCPKCSHYPLVLSGKMKGLDCAITNGKASCPVCMYESNL